MSEKSKNGCGEKYKMIQIQKNVFDQNLNKNSKFNIIKFSRLISKNSNTQVIIVNNEIELHKYLKKNLISNEIVIGMGAGIISKWMAELKYSL